jgi:elongation factor Tu
VRKTVVTGVEMFRKTPGRGSGGRQRGLPAAGSRADEVERGSGVGQAGLDQAAQRSFSGQVYVLKKEEGGRHTPFFNGYRPQFYIRTMDVTGSVTA